MKQPHIAILVEAGVVVEVASRTPGQSYLLFDADEDSEAWRRWKYWVAQHHATICPEDRSSQSVEEGES